MTPDFISALLVAIKILALVGFGMYIVFAVVIVRQEQLMANVLEEHFEPFLRLVALIHLVAAIVVFLLALILL